MTTSQETISDFRRDGEALHVWRHWIHSYYHFLEEMLIIQRDFLESLVTPLPRPRTAASEKHWPSSSTASG